jgi:sugar transferase (PEP-CTERM/EpsH1 system associated)
MTVHVVHLVASFDTGGLQNGIVNLANHMDTGRVRHTVLSISPQMGLADRLQHADALSLNIGAGTHRGAWRQVAESLRELDADILHTRNQATWPDGIRAARQARIRSRIHGFHGRDMGQIDGLPFTRRLLGRVLATATNRFVALTPSMRDEFAAEFFISPSRIDVIANGFDLSRFGPRAVDAKKLTPFTVATIGRLAPVKNISLLLRSFAGMKHRQQDDRLIVAGDGEERTTLELLTEKLGIAACVEFPGMVEDPESIYSAADIYVQPSLYEGMSNTIVEAMASGVPVIATNVGGNCDVVGQDGGGVLVPSNNADTLTAALDNWRSDKAARRESGLVGQQRALKRFSLERMVEAYLAVYESMDRS